MATASLDISVGAFAGDTPAQSSATDAAAIFLAILAALSAAAVVTAAATKLAAYVRERRRQQTRRRARAADLEWQLVASVVHPAPTKLAPRPALDRHTLAALQAPKVFEFRDADDRVAAAFASAAATGRVTRFLDRAVDCGLAEWAEQYHRDIGPVWRAPPVLTGDSVCSVTYSASLRCTEWVLTAHLRHWSPTLDRELGNHMLQRGHARTFEWPFCLLFVAPAHVVAVARHGQVRAFQLPTLAEAPDGLVNGRVVVWRNTLVVASRLFAMLAVYTEGPDRPPVRVERYVTLFVPTRVGGAGRLFMVAALQFDGPMRFYAAATVAQLVRPETWLEVTSRSEAARLGGSAGHYYRRFARGHHDISRNAPPETDGSAMDHWYAAPDRVRRRLATIHEACEQRLSLPVCAVVDVYLRRRGAGMSSEPAPAF